MLSEQKLPTQQRRLNVLSQQKKMFVTRTSDLAVANRIRTTNLQITVKENQSSEVEDDSLTVGCLGSGLGTLKSQLKLNIGKQ